MYYLKLKLDFRAWSRTPYIHDESTATRMDTLNLTDQLVSFALAKNIKKIVVLGGNLIMERLEFLRIKEFWSGSDGREADFCTTEECLRV